MNTNNPYTLFNYAKKVDEMGDFEPVGAHGDANGGQSVDA